MALLLVFSAACGDSPTKPKDDAPVFFDAPPVDPDGGPDAPPVDATADGGTDASTVDAATVDAAVDAAPDAPPDAPPDAAPDAAPDAPPDAPIDAPPPDAPPDAPVVIVDAAVDAPPPDAPIDAPPQCAANETDCFGVCKNLDTDPNNCGQCGNSCGAGNTCSDGKCCPSGQTNCNGVCVDTSTSNTNCGVCGTTCGAGETCSGSQCTSICTGGTTFCNGSCVDTSNDPTNCGTCGTTCTGGTVCSAGGCVCPQGAPDLCNGTCVDTTFDPLNCGTCGSACGASEVCSAGQCCPDGQLACGGTCLDVQNDEQNCGGCGVTCPAGSTCNNGQCDCGFGEINCNGTCVTPSIDRNNCGGCGNTCGAGEFCVSNGCTTSCPAPLSACNGECTNFDSDNDNCGACGTQCTGGLACSGGLCVPPVATNPPPAKCSDGGPPIDVPIGNETSCTGEVVGINFTFALCSCTDVGPLSRTLDTDGFDSTAGPYVPGDIGASVGVNNTISDTAKMTIGGDLWVAGAVGMEVKGDIDIAQRLFNGHELNFGKLITVDEDAFVGGPIVKSGSGLFQISGDLTTPNCATVPAGVTFAGCQSAPVVVPPPCRCDANEKVPVRAIVDFFRNPANNDNDELGIPQTIFNSPTGRQRLDLPCGVYYFDQINAGAPITIVAHGRVAIVVGGSITNSQELILDLDPTATMDIFVGGVVKASQDMTVGSPAYPRLSRVFIGSPSCLGSGGSGCTSPSDCCSGICGGDGKCGGNTGNLTNSFELSGNSFLNGLFYAGHGKVFISNPLEMYGAIFAEEYDASAPTKIHFDRAAVDAADECFEQGIQTCNDCSDCQNQACTPFGFCGSCAQDSDCCPPLRCGLGGQCEL